MLFKVKNALLKENYFFYAKNQLEAFMKIAIKNDCENMEEALLKNSNLVFSQVIEPHIKDYNFYGDYFISLLKMPLDECDFCGKSYRKYKMHRDFIIKQIKKGVEREVYAQDFEELYKLLKFIKRKETQKIYANRILKALIVVSRDLAITIVEEGGVAF